MQKEKGMPERLYGYIRCPTCLGWYEEDEDASKHDCGRGPLGLKVCDCNACGKRFMVERWRLALMPERKMREINHFINTDHLFPSALNRQASAMTIPIAIPPDTMYNMIAPMLV